MSILDDEDNVLTNYDELIHEWIKNNCKINGSYKINNGVVDVKGDVYINIDANSIEVQFGRVTGKFDCFRRIYLNHSQRRAKRNQRRIALKKIENINNT